jgi:hypothetical protein
MDQDEIVKHVCWVFDEFRRLDMQPTPHTHKLLPQADMLQDPPPKTIIKKQTHPST